MTRQLHIIIREHDNRPSDHQVSSRFLRGAISHDETISCAHAHEHALFLLEILDVMSYDCGVKKGEFKEIPEVTAMMKQLEQIVNLIPKEGQTRLK